MPIRYGALPEEWAHLDLILGLTADLLPVVSNPKAQISETSKIKAIGKTPSLYNKARKVVGIKDWTSYQAAGSDVGRWEKESDYGCCIQTRKVRAIDIDLERIELVNRVLANIQDTLGDVLLPRRFRSNSAKCLLAFKLAGEMPKRILRFDEGLIEFLGNGQQFVAHGTHTSGAKYEWDWNGQVDFPEISLETFERIWTVLSTELKAASITAGGARNAASTPDLNIDDSTLDKLNVLGWGRSGEAFIECPFKSEHTSDSGITETVYYPAGSRGYERGHFHCLHAHCADRRDEDFLDGLGLRDDMFEAIPDEVVVTTQGKEVVVEPLPRFKRDATGKITANLFNLHAAFMRPDICGMQIVRDLFRDETMLAPPGETLAWRSIRDTDYGFFKKHLEKERGFKDTLSFELIRMAIKMVGEDKQIDSAKMWLDSLVWDGVPRVDRFLTRYMGCEAGGYSRAVSRYMWTALPGRIIKPGIKVDMVPIFESEQGTFKSSTVEALSPSPEFFTTIDLGDKDVDLSRRMRGKLVAEIPELRGLRTREKESIKAFVTRTHEEWIPKYVEYSTVFPRRLVFFGTTNEKEILADETGNRRWLPIRTEYADIEAVRRDRDQLWAEGAVIFAKYGICFQEAELLAPNVHSDYSIGDPWQNPIRDWLYTREEMQDAAPVAKGYVKIDEVMRYALGIDLRNMKSAEAKRVGVVLHALRFSRVKKRFGEHTDWVWVPPTTQAIDEGEDLC